jgi:hypothetical protein
MIERIFSYGNNDFQKLSLANNNQKKLSYLFFINKKIVLILFLIIQFPNIYGQINIKKSDKNTDKILSLYEKNHFTGARLCNLKRHDYLICVVEIPKNISTDLDRLAQVKAQRTISEFLNGSNVSSNTLLILEENSTSKSNSTDSSMISSSKKEYALKMIDKISTNSSGFINSIECVSIREIENHQKQVYIFIKEIF